ncbi:DUF1996 domain-containing protein [Kineosporia sp. R_H_3]|uniref:DUF1996 domain-containing protein n=1 Tax=Kineosporia sp. R_H_3 TaxID=1961848 RepID=UPI000B4B49F2|nr:DUF1996 domain-containing protein [Kineosporia sp. R_H_3]
MTGPGRPPGPDADAGDDLRDLPDLRHLLETAYPDLPGPADRLERVGRLVRRRRRTRAAAAAGTLLVAAALAAVALPGGPRGGLGVVVVPPAGRDAPAPLPVPTGPTPSAGTARGTVTAALPPAASTGPGTGPGTTPGPAASTAAGPGPAARTPPGVPFVPGLIPAGSPGSGLRRVVATTQQPSAGDGTGIFRTVCAYSHMNTDDVLAAEGRGAGAVPLRTYWGNTSARAGVPGPWTSTGRSTCRGGTVDRSVYWVPSLVDTSTGAPVAPQVVHVYLSTGYGGVRPAEVGVLPPGLRMVAGDPGATGAQQHAWWTCWGGDGRRSASPVSCGDAPVELVVQFPQCWDGVRTDSPGHRAHLGYATGNGCPATRPVALPELSYHVLYPPTGPGGVRRWRLSTDVPGRPAGTSAHAGWANGWDPGIAAAWTEHCLRAAVSCGSHLLGDGRALEGDV